MVTSPYNANPELSVMKEDIAERGKQLVIKRMFITGLFVLAGAALGAFIVPSLLLAPAVAGFAEVGASLTAMNTLMGVMMGGGAGMMAGGLIAGVATMKESTKLQLDSEMLQSYMSGKNHWGAGYRQEVAEQGYGMLQAPGMDGRSFAAREGDRGPNKGGRAI